MRRTANQIVREQVESKIQLVTEVDSTITAICRKVKDGDVVDLDYAQVVSALAMLVVARSLLK